MVVLWEWPIGFCKPIACHLEWVITSTEQPRREGSTCLGCKAVNSRRSRAFEPRTWQQSASYAADFFRVASKPQTHTTCVHTHTCKAGLTYSSKLMEVGFGDRGWGAEEKIRPRSSSPEWGHSPNPTPAALLRAIEKHLQHRAHCCSMRTQAHTHTLIL